MAPSEVDLLHESLREFSEGLESSVPLRHFSEHKDEAKIEEAVQLLSDKVFMHFSRKIKAHNVSRCRKGDLMKEFWSGVDKLADKYVTKNQDYKTQSGSFLGKQVDACCEDFRTSIEAKLLINPDMDLKAVEEFFKLGKLKVTDCFEHFWKHGNVSGFEEQKTLLKDKLDRLKMEFVWKQRLHLQIKSDEKARKSLEEVKAILLEMARPFKCDIGTRPQGTMDIKIILKEKVEGIHNFVVGKGKVIEEKYGKLYLELLGHLEDSMKFLEEELQVMSVEDASRWMERLNQQLRFYFMENERHEQNIHVPRTGNESEMSGTGNVSAQMNENEGSEVKPEETKLAIIAVTSLQPETQLKTADMVGELTLDSESTIRNEVNLEQGIKRHHQIDLNATSASVTPPASKKLKQSDPDNSQERKRTVVLSDHDCALNVPGDDCDFPLLCTLREDKGIECIEKMLENGASVNIKETNGRQRNAAHLIFKSLINKRRSPADAFGIMNLLMTNEFNLINDGDTKNRTPLHYAIYYEDINEEMLKWFYDNGAYFNAVGGACGNSVLFYAIPQQHGEEVIRKIIEFGGDPKYVNKRKWNALHMSARNGNETALEIFIDKLDVNEVTKSGDTPLHLLFSHSDMEYEDCLEILIKKGADFTVKCNKGYTPLAKWMRYEGNPFPALVKMKDLLPINKEIASTALTIIVSAMERKKELLPSSSGLPQNEFGQFILFLINERKAKLIWNLKDEHQWKLLEWKKLDKDIFTSNFFRELKTAAGVNRMGELVGIKSKNLGELQLLMKYGYAKVQLEGILACILASKNYQGFAEVCLFVNKFFTKGKK